jgi:hypothetical protein
MRVLLALCFSIAAASARADSALDRYFHALDLDGDGYVSLAEAAGEPIVVQRFDRADKDRDGRLSRKEFANLRKVKVRIAKKKEPGAAVGASAKKRKPEGAAAAAD